MPGKRKRAWWIFIGCGIVLVGIALLILNQHPVLVSTVEPLKTEQLRRTNVIDAKAAFDQGTALFIDVRGASSYEQSHIPGAVLIPLIDLPNRLAELDPSGWIITYCT